jgi:RHS repeat-associated protein
LILLLALSSFSASASERVTYYHNDHLGSPVAATNAQGDLLWQEEYSPYGKRLVKADTSDNPRAYTGHQDVVALGLTYMDARWYDPELGRFLAIDPVDFHEGNIQSFNRYAYANNNPYRYVDPDGESPFDIGFLVVDVVRLGVAIYKGEGVGAAAVDVGLSAVGVLSPVPGTGLALKSARTAKTAKGLDRAGDGAGVARSTTGRSGKQARLRELSNDPKLGSADRGWIKQEMNSIERGQRKSIRNPPGKDLAHERGREAAKGYGYKHSNLQDRDLHRLQHKYDNFGRKNNERPPSQ